MARGRSRWSSKSLRSVFPVRRERSAWPRADGWYGSPGQIRLRISASGLCEFDSEHGDWSIAAGVFLVTTPRWQCEGALDSTTAYLLCSPDGRVADRVQLELKFHPDVDGVN